MSVDVPRGQKNPLHFGLPLRLKTLRHASGLTRVSIEGRAQVSNGTVSYVEGGRMGERAPAVDTVERIARALGVTACFLAYGEDGPKVFRQKTPRAERPAVRPELTHEAPNRPLACEGLPARLQLAREARGLSRRALGRVSATSDTTVRQVEQGRMVPSVATAEQLAGALEVSPCWLAYGVGAGPETSER